MTFEDGISARGKYMELEAKTDAGRPRLSKFEVLARTGSVSVIPLLALRAKTADRRGPSPQHDGFRLR